MVGIEESIVAAGQRGARVEQDGLVPGKLLQLLHAERGQDLRGRQRSAADQLVDADGMVVKLAEQGQFLVGEGKFDRMSSTVSTRRRGHESGSDCRGWPGCPPGRARRRPRGSAPSRGARWRASRSAARP